MKWENPNPEKKSLCSNSCRTIARCVTLNKLLLPLLNRDNNTEFVNKMRQCESTKNSAWQVVAIHKYRSFLVIEYWYCRRWRCELGGFGTNNRLRERLKGKTTWSVEAQGIIKTEKYSLMNLEKSSNACFTPS